MPSRIARNRWPSWCPEVSPSQPPRTAEPLRPDPERHDRYGELLAAHRELGERVVGVFERLGGRNG